jgi:serine/threonine protein kinase
MRRRLDGSLNGTTPYDVTQDHRENLASNGNAAPAEHPQRIGRYRIEKVLGKGGFGLVYLGHDEQLERLVAIKVPHAKLISQPEDAEAYLAEARTVANLDHPHIVPVFDVGSTEDCPCYVVSKYIEGTDLATKIKESRPKYRGAAELVATVAEALHYAHKQGLVHRDVKPGNILIDGGGQPFVVDFGLALREQNIGKGPNYAGTPAYMSPEQARGEGHRVDGRSDILGRVDLRTVRLWQVVAGKGGTVASAFRRSDAGLHRGDCRRDGNPITARLAQAVSLTRRQSKPQRYAGGVASQARLPRWQESADRSRPV